ncbi:MAG TPA: site-2 protease family protein, partial [Cyanobacteria bacterium UBA11049]|nr:site-2 protease family protein [Cyanobacteria bacterium UBA11049]
MFTASETSIISLTVLVALGILGWGFYRARRFGKLGILAWLQSVVLMAPWLLFFGLFATGIYINLAGVLLLLVGSTVIYVYLGNRLRAAGQDAVLRAKATERLNSSNSQTAESPDAAVKPTSEKLKIEVVPPIPEEDLNAIRGIFGIDTFFATETIPYQEGAIFKGNLRGEPDTVYDRLNTSLQERLGARYRLFLVENAEGKPVFIVLPSSNDPRPSSLSQKIFAAVLFVGTIATSLETGGLLQGFDVFTAPTRYQEAIPIALGILAVLVSHEIGHRVLAQRYQVRLSPPFFLPTLQIGAFGAITKIESLLPNRKVLFDIALAGPAAGGIVSLLMLLAGLILSHPGSLFQVP